MGNRNLAALAITGYQRHISPYKGFCCAHRVLTGGVSCSEYAKRAIIQNGLFASLKPIFRRFHQCKESALSLKENKQPEKGGDKKNNACMLADALACVPTSCADMSFGTTVGGAAGGCDACACTPF
ncbi:MAG: membrane protein insertion efficiency factor YidD [Gammaproteobacteria bacterium]|nr:membrane protein insertion efficiency factor YidD [Gammaproteobacteria bacterium]MCB1849583.1 membrane protein insertion efficiency factor YidD [Gammaproteobacteria bacterium]